MTPPEDSISVIVPAFNEEQNLAATVDEVTAAVEGEFADYEIIIFNDASSDGTARVADSIASSNGKVRVVHNETNKGLGWNYRAGLRTARMNYVTLVNGKHDIAADQLKRIFAARGRADVIVPYHTNRHERPLVRQILSRAYTTVLNVLFGYNFHYYNDSALHKREVVAGLSLRTDSYAFTAEALIKSLRAGSSHVEVPIRNLYPKGVKTSAFRIRNIIQVLAAVARLVYDVRIKGEYRRG